MKPQWVLSIKDTVRKKLPVNETNDVFIYELPAFIGGRPSKKNF